ncbi:bifunctional 23S rRNA (guanine(2069)-N(7))-methyltransferase RlmK/23S rRNA (guanine(2445)-N(2))-methyltransferase RlmL [Psychrobacter sp. I-STPA10]|uniref:bifunctional 23S rRNA (guanine(2069)-N(7))-methyltransferase RlmK/23S rRNA (guanine(2445)-N(2))-methyltransferase RlmL n=1 Tax=Psychrobacter sp. I-STPA10 TaxID=2585769 RepID=UPI001E33B4E0|nr:bifunctional 23S rRNA (guanine(2069)-N(7))-methyltransferase RlmK/23S rRNA (guanine(2445)-N(2))-methyltransferase RlmL [Psychrobacter sp. I-STPA10]
MSTPVLANSNNQPPKTASQQTFAIVITCADGLEAPLQTELTTFGIASDISSTGRLNVTATLAQIYTICLWSRVASRVLLPIKRRNINIDYDIAEQLYGLASTVDWTTWFNLDNTFAIRVSVDKRMPVSQQFAMLRTKDAIADSFNKKYAARPDVDSEQPDFPIYVNIADKTAELYLDISGTSLHRRGYRVAMTDAPLKENLAAALLYSVGWHEKDRYDAIIDPMCGSGTFLIEALLMRCDYAVGLDKAEGQFGFYHWQHHDSELWQQMVIDATERFHDALATFSDAQQAETNNILPTIIGYDADVGAIKATLKNMIAAGLQPIVSQVMLQHRPLNQLKAGLSDWQQQGKLNAPLIITNPPYGERLGDEDMIKPLYQGLGLILQETFVSSKHAPTLGLLAAHVEQADVLPIAKPQTLRCHNGAITVYFRYGTLITKSPAALIHTFEKKEISVDAGQDFINRLQKNVAKLKKQAGKQNITNLRLYDADLPDFKVAIDVYADNVHVQEYAPPKSIPPETAKKRFNLALMGIREVFGIDREQVFIKTRARQSGKDQYSKQGGNKQGKFYIVQEDNAYFYVNFTDYLDTGLFIDHRNMRALVKAASSGKNVLNLFAYTCTASVHAALAGAKTVTSVDLSQNYLDWGRRNFALNGLDISTNQYQFVAEDIFEWIKDNTEQFDTIFIDPPTFSNSKKFQGTFDVQRDHAALINRAMNRLATDGILYFSNNFTKFELDDELRQRYDVTDITHKTIGFDFNPKRPIHQSFEIRHR